MQFSFLFSTSNFQPIGPPLAPNLMLEVMDEGTVLNISWEKPYSPEGFPILSYNLTLHNVTSNSSHLLLQADTPTYYLLNSTDYNNVMCNVLRFTVTAASSVGSSDDGAISGGFPICE